MLVPSAFTIPTGKAHWEVLLRARAIETQSYVIAAAQVSRYSFNGVVRIFYTMAAGGFPVKNGSLKRCRLKPERTSCVCCQEW